MKLHVGTSGYSYKEWKGSFYPEKLPAAKMLPYYAERFGTVEINNTFYRMPAPKTMEQWASAVPEGFRFSIKAPQRITHQKKLVDCADDVRYLFDCCAELGDKLGPVLFQLPPFYRFDRVKLESFLELLPAGGRIAFEFRHGSWFNDEVFSMLRSRNVALCMADTDEEPIGGLNPTADWGYLRLRRLEYSGDDLQQWKKRITGQPWSEAYVFFKHEDEGKGPQFAMQFLSS